MPKIDIKGIPSIGTLTVDAPGFATELTLSKLTAIMAGTKNTTAKANREVARSASDTSSSLDNLEQSADNAAESVQDAGESLNNEMASLGKQFSESMGEITRGLARVLSVGNSSQGMSNSIDLFSEAAKKATNILYLIPGAGIIGKALLDTIADAVIGVIGDTAKFYITQTETLRNFQVSLMDANLQFGHGLDEANGVLKHSKVSFEELISTANTASGSLRQMSGGPVKAVTRVVKSFDLLGEENQKYLLALGYSREQVLAGIANYGASAERFGRELSIDELANGSNAYLRNLKELQRLTGLSVEEQQSRLEANRNNLYIQNEVNKVQGEARVVLEQFIAQVDPAIQDFVLSRQSNTQEGAIIASELRTYVNGMADIADKAKSGRYTLDQALEAQRELLKDPRIVEELNATRSTWGQVQSSLYGSLSGMADTFGLLYARISDQLNVAKEGPVVISPEDRLTDNVTQLVTDTARTGAALQTLAIGLEELESHAVRPLLTTIRDATEYAKFLMVGNLYEHPDAVLLDKRQQELQDTTNPMDDLSSDEMFEKLYGRPFKDSDIKTFEEDTKDLAPEDILQKKILMDQIRNGNNSLELDGGGLSSGGEVARGKTYLVGEEGPEVITAPSPGQAYANDAPITVKLSDASDFKDMVEKLTQLTKINQSMLRAMERGNTISAQNGYASA